MLQATLFRLQPSSATPESKKDVRHFLKARTKKGNDSLTVDAIMRAMAFHLLKEGRPGDFNPRSVHRVVRKPLAGRVLKEEVPQDFDPQAQYYYMGELVLLTGACENSALPRVVV